MCLHDRYSDLRYRERVFEQPCVFRTDPSVGRLGVLFRRGRAGMFYPFLVVFYLSARSYSQGRSSGQVTKHGEVGWGRERGEGSC